MKNNEQIREEAIDEAIEWTIINLGEAASMLRHDECRRAYISGRLKTIEQQKEIIQMLTDALQMIEGGDDSGDCEIAGECLRAVEKINET